MIEGVRLLAADVFLQKCVGILRRTNLNIGRNAFLFNKPSVAVLIGLCWDLHEDFTVWQNERADVAKVDSASARLTDALY